MAKSSGKSSSGKTTTTTYRSAKTGEYVKPGYAKSHPSTTVKETNKTGKK